MSGESEFQALMRSRLNVVERAEALCRLVALADLDGVPLYILTRADAPSEFYTPGCAGWHDPTLDLQLEPELRKAGRWRGRGIALCVYHDIESAGRGPSRFYSTLLHELAHGVIGRRAPIGYLQRDEFPPVGRVFLERPKTGSIDRSHNGATGPRWRPHHGRDWIRVAIHIVVRAQRCGLWVTAGECGIAGRTYGLSSAAAYERALGLEPREWEDRRLADLADVDPPMAFAKLWQDDTAGAF